uniref:Uncharacterized protein n=1 Tax=Stomoxys calcitrans TaxID=35570 RepID=A0A1I8NLN7_STOCA
MERWCSKVAVVTGASKGIGAAIVHCLLKNGIRVVGLSRSVENMEEFRNELPLELQPILSALKCNVGDVECVNKTFDEIESKYGGIGILVNSAGTMNPNLLLTGDVAAMQEILQTNVLGVVHCTQKAFSSMRQRKFDGHVFILNSILGHPIPIFPKDIPSMLGMYIASKWAIKALTEYYRQEFRHFDTKIKVTSISPGITDTTAIDGYAMTYSDGNFLNANDIAESFLYALATPPHVQIHEVTVKPVAEFIV